MPILKMRQLRYFHLPKTLGLESSRDEIHT